ncbi:MAG: hypothetical protein SGILL_009990, partial [Bacillariaceae sp.]
SDEYTFDPEQASFYDDDTFEGHDHAVDGETAAEKVLAIQNARIEILMQANKEKEDRLENLEKQLNAQQVQKKEGIYWLQLQLDTARREKDAAEERMAELQADLQEMVQLEENERSNTDLADTCVQNGLHQKLQKFETTMGVMENQLAMVQTSSGEVIKTLKEEIADLMEDRSGMEIDLLNQLSALDQEKQRTVLEYELRLNEQDETIAHLQSQNSGGNDVDPLVLKEEIKKLRVSMKTLQEQAEKERIESDEVIRWMKDDKAKLQGELDAALEDLTVFRSGTGSGGNEAAVVLNRVAKEREALNSSMERLGEMWELADSSVSQLEDTMDKLRPNDNAQVGGDGDRLLTTLESASLLHGEIKVSLLLIELKLQNQLACLKNDKLTLGSEAPSDEAVTRTMEEIQKDALTALRQVESALSEQMKELEETAMTEAVETKAILKERVTTLEKMKTEYSELETEISELKISNHGSNTSSSGEDTVLISAPVMNQLHTEVLHIVERIQEKNETIQSLRKEVEESKSREDNLRKELKRQLRTNNASHNAAKGNAVVVTPTKPKTKKIISPDKKKLLSPAVLPSPTKAPVRTPVKGNQA